MHARPFFNLAMEIAQLKCRNYSYYVYTPESLEADYLGGGVLISICYCQKSTHASKYSSHNCDCSHC